MATSTNSLIRVTDVCKEYNGGSVHALSHCNLSVKKGEVENIEPFAETADLKINTYFHYEKSCFVNDAREILSLLPQNSVYRPMADAILGQLAGVEQIDIGLVPENSLLWEFLKR